VDRGIAVENKWRAQRYGVETTFASPAGAISMTEALGHALDAVAPDAEAMGCSDDVVHCREIVRAGSSADAQLRAFMQGGGPQDSAGLSAVLGWIAGATIP
jgi:glutamate---cysteine ligase / carboxylate-amine ligase